MEDRRDRAQVAPAQAAPAQAAPARAAPAQVAPVQVAPAQVAPAQAAPMQAARGPATPARAEDTFPLYPVALPAGFPRLARPRCTTC